MKKLIFLSWFLVLAWMVQSQKVNLKLNLENGKTYNQHMKSVSSIAQEVAGQKMNIQMEINGNISYTVSSSENEVYDLIVRYESLDMTMELPMKGKVTFSSQNKELTDPASKILSTLAGSSFRVKMTDKGEVKEVIGLDSLLSKILTSSAEVPQAQVEQLKAQINGAYGAQSFKKNFAMISGAFPVNPVEVGESWTNETSIENIMSMKMTSKFTLVSADAQFYQIDSESTLNSVNNSLEAKGMKMSYDLHGAMKASLILHKNSGWTQKAEMEQTIEGAIQMEQTPQMPDGMKIPMSIHTVVTFTE